MSNKYIFLFFFTVKVTFSFTQSSLTIDEAIKIAIANNFDIEDASTLQTISEMQIYRANAGFGPSLDLNLNLGSSFNQVNQEFVDGRVISRFGRAYNPNTNLGLAWTLYDGHRMQNRLNILEEQAVFAKIGTQSALENVVFNVKTAYYNILRNQETINFLQNVMKFYEERTRITKERWEVGRGSKLDYLTALSDENAQQSAISDAEVKLKNAKTYLNLLLNRNEKIAYTVTKDKSSTPAYELNQIVDNATKGNLEVIALNKSIDINKLSELDWAGAKKPRVTFNSSFGYSFSNNNAGLILLNQNLGLNLGLNATWNIFDGGHNKKQLSIAQVGTDLLRRRLENVKSRIKAEIVMAYDQWENDKIILEMERENLLVNDENLQISLEKFRLGSSTILEVSEAQRRYDLSQNRYVNAQYNIQLSELQLQRIAGMLY